MNINFENLKVVFGVNEVGAAHFLLNNFLQNYKFKDYIIFAEHILDISSANQITSAVSKELKWKDFK